MTSFNSEKVLDDIESATNPNLPYWFLTPKEEKVVFERWRKKAFDNCDKLIRNYIDCTNSYANPITSMRKCKEANRNSLGCVKQYQKKQFLDIEKDLYIKEKLEKKMNQTTDKNVEI